MIKEELKLSISAMRVFNHIFTKKEKKNILDEALYFANIYKKIHIDKLIEYSINKHLKIKIHHRNFCDINKNVMEYKRVLMEEYGKYH